MKRIILILLCGTGIATNASKQQARIVGGEVSSVLEHPYVVSLQTNGRHYCGGSLIRENVVLTAAHCVDFLTPEDITVVLGSQKRSPFDSSAEVISVREVAIHPNFQSTQTHLTHDFALLFLQRASLAGLVTMLNGAESLEAFGGVTPLALGWGTIRESGPLSEELMQVNLPLVDKKTCSEAYPGVLDDSMLCAGFREGRKDTCQGDSGGPLVMETITGLKVQIGVVSWGHGCARKDKFGIYANVAYASSWIASQIN